MQRKWETPVGIDYREHKEGSNAFKEYGPISVILKEAKEGKYSNDGDLKAMDALVTAVAYAKELTAEEVVTAYAKKPAGQEVSLNRSFFNVDAITASPKGSMLYISNYFGRPNITPLSAKAKSTKRALR
mgnify:CR=1 FL=1|jgi:hypothetical protein|tara:strand:+ start:202 stop:588 length:387 start_codon:yes stop_codon:yes gene_type:complete